MNISALIVLRIVFEPYAPRLLTKRMNSLEFQIEHLCAYFAPHLTSKCKFMAENVRRHLWNIVT